MTPALLDNTSHFCKLFPFFKSKLTCPGKITLMDVIPVPEEIQLNLILTWIDLEFHGRKYHLTGRHIPEAD